MYFIPGALFVERDPVSYEMRRGQARVGCSIPCAARPGAPVHLHCLPSHSLAAVVEQALVLMAF